MGKEKLRASLHELETHAARAGVPVRYESFKVLKGKERETSSLGRGGLVRLGPQSFVLCEQSLPLIDKIAVLAEALSAIGVDVLDLPPIVRARIQRRPAKPRRRLVLERGDPKDASGGT